MNVYASRILKNNPLPAIALYCCALFGLQNISVHAAEITSNWDGTDNGTAAWDLDANWDNDTWPRNFGGNNYLANIGNANGDRVITVPTISALWGLSVTQTATGGSTTLQLGGSVTLNGSVAAPATVGVTNTTGDLSRVVLELNAYTFTALNYGNYDNFGRGGYTVRSTGNQGGILAMRKWRDDLGAGIAVQDNVTVKLGTAERSEIDATKSTVSSSSTIQMTHTSVSNVEFWAHNNLTIGNLVIGASTNSAATRTIIAGTPLRVSGNVLINSYTGATGGAASILTLGNSAPQLYVGGDFTDSGADNIGYGDSAKTIVFNGGEENERILSTGRGVATSFRVGEDISTPGNIALGQNLTTTGGFSVLSMSTLNVQNHNLTAGTFTGSSSMTLTYTFGSANGHIQAGNLNLAEFDLNLIYDNGGWIDGDDLVLFNYSGVLTGTPELGEVFLPNNWAFDSLVSDLDSKSIYLSNVRVVPEPSVVLLGGLGISLLLLRRRRRQEISDIR